MHQCSYKGQFPVYPVKYTEQDAKLMLNIAGVMWRQTPADVASCINWLVPMTDEKIRKHL